MFKPKPGQYYYGPHRCLWGVWNSDGTFYDDYPTKEEAARVVKELNHWK